MYFNLNVKGEKRLEDGIKNNDKTYREKNGTVKRIVPINAD